VRERRIEIALLLNGEVLARFQLFRHGWLHLSSFVPAPLAAKCAGNFELEIRADRTWRPRPSNDGNRDDREISIAVCNLEIKTLAAA